MGNAFGFWGHPNSRLTASRITLGSILFAAKYQLILPNEAVLAHELEEQLPRVESLLEGGDE